MAAISVCIDAAKERQWTSRTGYERPVWNATRRHSMRNDVSAEVLRDLTAEDF
jgi:hypothetical protein